MKNHLAGLGIVILIMSVIGCAGVTSGPGGVRPGGLFTATTIPIGLTADLVYQAYPDSFTVIGMVEGTSESSNILGIVSSGDGGYRAAIDDAIAQVDADGLINCVADIKTSSVLGFYAKSTTIVRGLAIKRK